MSQSDSPIDPAMNTEERVRLLEERLREMQERHAARHPRALLERAIPPEARRHLRAAQRERLLAMRAVLDAAIKRTEDQPPERPKRAESVRID